ncbi:MULTISPECIES: hypothetical protein [Microbacterium]|uniref:hypothetical protein n=1 Tax=Microbacterium TaxID=33882 RepID=UPI00146ED52C|nr:MULTISPECIES: hypothetical protein [Microbacterium]
MDRSARSWSAEPRAMGWGGGVMPQPETTTALSIGIVLGDADAQSMVWRRELASLGKRVQAARDGVNSVLDVNVVFHVDGRIGRNEFEGFRIARYSARERTVMVQVAVGGSLLDPLEATMFSWLEDAVDIAEEFARERGLADELPAARQVLANLRTR